MAAVTGDLVSAASPSTVSLWKKGPASCRSVDAEYGRTRAFAFAAISRARSCRIELKAAMAAATAEFVSPKIPLDCHYEKSRPFLFACAVNAGASLGIAADSRFSLSTVAT